MTTPLLAALVIGFIGLAMLGREARRVLRADFRYASDPREARLSSLTGAVVGLAVIALAGGLIGLLAGLSRYVVLEDGPTPAVIVAVEPDRTGGWKVSFPEHPPNVTMPPMTMDGEWFAIVADKVVWRGPLAWVGFRDALRPSTLLAAKTRDDIARPDAIRRIPISPDNLFEKAVAGPLARIGLCRFGQVRTPWRPLRTGSREYLFTESGVAEQASPSS